MMPRRTAVVTAWIQKSSNANTVDVARRVHVVMEKMNSDPALEGIDVLLFFDQSEEILNGVNGLRDAGLQGGLLAIGILYFFLRRISTTSRVRRARGRTAREVNCASSTPASVDAAA